MRVVCVTVDDFETESEFGDDRKSLQSFQSAVSVIDYSMCTSSSSSHHRRPRTHTRSHTY